MDPERISEFLMNHWIISAAWVLVVAILTQNLWELATRKYKPISTVGVVGLINSQEPVILDVREAFEYAKGHIQDSINIPAAKLEKRLSELEKYKNQSLIVACQTGTRSTSSCKKLKTSGFSDYLSSNRWYSGLGRSKTTTSAQKITEKIRKKIRKKHKKTSPIQIDFIIYLIIIYLTYINQTSKVLWLTNKNSSLFNAFSLKIFPLRLQIHQ